MKLFLDLETYSSVDLSKCGAAAYADAPDFRILLVGWAVDDGPVQVDETLTPRLRRMLENSKWTKIAHNASFERTCLQACGIAINPAQWEDTMHMAARQGLPRSLALLSKVLDLGEKGKKDGARLIKLFCSPPGKKPEEAPEEWKAFRAYNAADVEAERAIYARLSQFNTLPAERQVEILDAEVNARGVAVDMDLVAGAQDAVDLLKNDAFELMQHLSGLSNPNSNTQAREWLRSRGIDTPQIRAGDYEALIRACNLKGDKTAAEFLKIRGENAKSAVAKYDAIARAQVDGRIRGMTQYYGANTGRWAGRLVQLQNLKRNSIPDLAKARELVKSVDIAGLCELYPDVPPMEVLGQLIRTALIPAKGRKFVVADFSAIEARVLAWLAGVKWRNDVFAQDGDIYKSSYSQAFGVPIADIDKDMRQKGKIMELALGYGGGLGALKAFGADKLGLSEGRLTELVYKWRQASPEIPEFWRRAEACFRAAAYDGCCPSSDGTQGNVIPVGGRYYLGFARRPSLVCTGWDVTITLPGGRQLVYPNARCKGKKLVYTVYESGKVVDRETYGGKLAENITQAVARDCLAAAMLRLAAKGFAIVAHIHDEVIIEAPLATEVKEIEGIMGAETFRGLHTTAKGYEGAYYYKD